ncbi:MAG: 4Fe-4S binding protein [Sedimentisphaerales bacterium]|nr:4Fe-4S binding protein [Sedimentisphaerales bacterium]
MRYPKLRELKEAVTAVFSPRFTTKFPAEPCVVPEKYRGKPEFDLDTCIGCGACVNVCPTRALTQVDDTQAKLPLRKITVRYDACIFCGNCHENCTTETGINLTNEWDLAGLDRDDMATTHEYELQMCEKCGALIGTKKHLLWLYDKLGPLAYTNPSILLAKSGQLHTHPNDIHQPAEVDAAVSDFMRILCPKCKCGLNIKM